MKQIIVKRGRTILENVPEPFVQDKTVLVRVSYSCISQGTEISGVRASGKSKAEKIIDTIKDKPQTIQKAIEIFKKEGTKKLLEKFHSTSRPDDASKPLGYSLSGVVEAVGEGIDNLKIGDNVACAGAGIASHAEYVVVPRNLLTKVPEGLDLKLAATVALGGIAMQGVRRGDFKLGEYVAVIGLGFLGLLTVRMLRLAGCRVIAIDVDDHRCEIAKQQEAEKVYNSAQYRAIEDEVVKYTHGKGVDGVIFTAATSNPQVISQAFKMCKSKGRVVLVGVAGKEINRNDLYQKELELLLSTSYGPGRYDDHYEIEGIDYPYAYVRWTENRNMEEYLRLLRMGNINIIGMIEKIYPIEDTERAYEELQQPNHRPVIALFEYNAEAKIKQASPGFKIKPFITKKKSIINTAIIGAGNFAKGTHLPNLQKISDKYCIHAICDLNPLNAKKTAEKFNAHFATTHYQEVLSDENVDMVMICTRHGEHAKLSMEALNAGKAVFVEKPMATNQAELDALVQVLDKTRRPFMVGFNRRFSCFAQEIKKHVINRTNPMIINYRMNAGYAPPEAWVHKDGGRIIGEGCHIIDLFSYFTDAVIESISAERISPHTKAFLPTDNISLNLKYDDGTVANLMYTSLGNPKYPKEILELYCDNKVFKMTDYLVLEIFNNGYEKKILKQQDKGHLQEMIEFYNTIISGEISGPINLKSIIETTKATLMI